MSHLLLPLCGLALLIASPAFAQEDVLLSIPEQIQTPRTQASSLRTPAASPSDEQAAEIPVDLTRELKPTYQLNVDVHTPAGKLPRDFAAERLAENPTPAGAVLVRGWPVLDYHWKAPGSRHNPLYFEEVNAERYGYTCCHCLQPAISAAHFFGTIPVLPYLMAADCPRECVYTLGHYRPGACNPWRRHCWPCRLDAAAVEAGVAVGLIALIP